MLEIKRNIKRSATFSYEGFSLPYAFVKVEQVAKNSNYYCLWITEDKFHLFNLKTKEYALKINSYKESKTFSRIEHYSRNTRTFVAYRSDEEYAYLLFEDGEYENHIFKYVGEEHNGIRAVKGYNNRWVYYNVLKKCFTFPISKGLLLDEDEELVPLFNLKYYTIYKIGLYYRLLFFDTRKHQKYQSDKIEFFEDTKNNHVIGKLFNRDIYALFRRTNLITPIGYFNSKPQYIDTRNIFIAKKLNSYVIVDENKEISNCQWTKNCFIFHNNYILNKSAGETWKLYSFNEGKEICTNWTNIRYDSEQCCIIADTYKKKSQIITESDIENLYSLLLEKSKKCFGYIQSDIVQEDAYKSNNSDIVCIKSPNDNKEIVQNTDKYNELPSCIDFVAFAEHITISQEGYIISSKAFKMLSTNNHVCWIIQDRQIIAISRFLNTKAHKIIYYKENVDSNIFKKSIQAKGFVRKNIKIVSGEDSLFNELSIYDYKSSIMKKNTTIPCPADKLMKGNVSKFYFDNVAYSLKVDDIWNNTGVFTRRQFVLKHNIIAILLDSTSKKFVEDNITYYEIIGEGKDKRFDQDFGPTNSSIKDNSKRIILFKYSNGNIIFKDEVICVGFRIEYDDGLHKNGRKIIIFQLRSLLSNTPCNNHDLVTTNEDPIEDGDTTKIPNVTNEDVLNSDCIKGKSNNKTSESALNYEDKK